MSIILDKIPLGTDWTPPKLLHRQRKLSRFHSRFDKLFEGGKPYQLLLGTSGAGKSVTAERFAEDFSKRWKERNARVINIDCLEVRTRDKFIKTLWKQLGTPSKPSLEGFEAELRARGLYLVLILDDVDGFLVSEQQLIQRFFELRAVQQAGWGFGLLLISHSLPLETLPFRPAISKFDRYSNGELLEILNQRIELALTPGAIGADSLELILEISKGDARIAIELLEGSAKACENKYGNEITPEDVRGAKKEVYPYASDYKLRYLPRHEKFCLLGIARELKHKAVISTGEAELAYGVAAEEFDSAPRAHTQYWEYLKDLEKEGLVELQVTHSGGTTHRIAILDVPVGPLGKRLEELLNMPDYAWI